MAGTNDIQIRILADLREVKAQLADLAATSKQTSASLVGAFTGAYSSLAKFGLAVQGVQASMVLLSAPIRAVVGAAAEFETLRARLESLYGSADKAQRVFKVLADVASTTPFELSDVVEAGVTLKAFGLNAETTTKRVADLAAFMGTTAREAAEALGRAFAGGAGAADVLRDRGILNLIKSFQGIEDLTKLTLPEFREVMLATLADPAAGIAGSTDRLAQTFTGALSNMKDSATQLAATVGEAFNDNLKTGLIGLTGVLGDLGAMVRSAFGLTEQAKIAGEAAQLRALGYQLKELRESTGGAAENKERLAGVIQQMTDLAPEYLKGLDLEAGAWEDIAAAMERADANYRARIRQLTLQDDLLEIDKKLLAIEQDQTANLERQAFINQRILGDMVAILEDPRANIQSLWNFWKRDALAALEEVDAKGVLSVDSRVEEIKAALEAVTGGPAVRELENLRAAAKRNTEATAELEAEYTRLMKLIPAVAQASRDKGAGDDAAAAAAAARAKREMEALAKVDKARRESYRDAAEFTRKSDARLQDEVTKTLKIALDALDAQHKDFLTKSRKRAEEVKEAYRVKLAETTKLLEAFSFGVGEALEGGFARGASGFRDGLKSMLNSLLAGIEQLVVGAKIAGLAKALVTASFAPGASLAAIAAQLPAIIGLEALFAGLRLGVSRMATGSGPITSRTMALLGEDPGRSGAEFVLPEIPFVAWAERNLLPRLLATAGRQATDSRGHELLKGIQGRLERLERAMSPGTFGRAAGRSMGRELALAGRYRL